MSETSNPRAAARALDAGAHGYALKTEKPYEIVAAIRDLLADHLYVSEAVLAPALERRHARG